MTSHVPRAVVLSLRGWWVHFRMMWAGPFKDRDEAIQAARSLAPVYERTFRLVYVETENAEEIPITESRNG